MNFPTSQTSLYIFLMLIGSWAIASESTTVPVDNNSYVENFNSMTCDELNTELKYKILRFKQLKSEMTESQYRNAGVGLASLFLFAPTILAAETCDAVSSEFSKLNMSIIEISNLLKTTQCPKVSERLERFKGYIIKLDKE